MPQELKYKKMKKSMMGVPGALVQQTSLLDIAATLAVQSRDVHAILAVAKAWSDAGKDIGEFITQSELQSSHQPQHGGEQQTQPTMGFAAKVENMGGKKEAK